MKDLFHQIKENASKENNIWNVRLNYWKKLKDYNDKKADKIKPDLRFTKKTAILTLIEVYLTKQFSFLGIFLDKLYELSKYPFKWLLKAFNRKVVYHQFGIDAIRKNMVLNQKLKEVSKVISSLQNKPTISLIRNKIG